MAFGQSRSALGDLLRSYREHRGLSQEELASLTVPPLSTETVSNVERGRTRPYRHTLHAVCRALDLDDTQLASVWAAWRMVRPLHTEIGVAAPEERRRDNLPLPATRLVGRELEVRELSSWFRNEDARLVTLVGPGGVGKTRLALATAESLQGHFAEAVFFVDLSAVHDPELVLSAFARGLKIRVEANTIRDSLIVHLGDRRVLLVADNFEQVLGAATELTELLAACSGLTLLLTSREPLAVRWERVFSVLPLGLPSNTGPLTVGELREVPSVALFVERAQSSDATFELNSSNAATVGAVCARLDGLPLAIELAAAHVRALPPNVLLTHLDQWLDLLTGPRDAPARQHSLRTTLAWSHDLLGPAERTMFRRLGIFADGAGLNAVEAVCSTGDTIPLATLATLVDKYLVVHVASSADEPRYRLLETVRAYALEQLSESCERTATAERHAQYYLALAEHADLNALDTQLATLDREYDNMRAALSWLVGSRDADRSQRLATALAPLWSSRGDLDEGQDWFGDVMALAGRRSCLVRARALNAAARLAWLAHDYGGTTTHPRRGADTLYAEALVVAREVNDAQTIADALGGLALVAMWNGDLPAARVRFEETLHFSQENSLDVAVAAAQRGLGRVALELGELDSAEAHLMASLSAARDLDRREDAAGTLYELGMLAFLRGDSGLPRIYFDDSLAIFDELNHRAQTAYVRLCLGIVELRECRFEVAREHMLFSVRASQASRDQHALAECLEALACLASARGDIDRAMRVYGAALALRDKVGLRRSVFKQASVDAWLGQRNYTDALVAEGRAMPLERALELALATGDVS
jgi:predicted ATPase/transcriptional regulator with XRE-family HTH domain